MGKPLPPAEVRCADADGEAVAAGEVGEVRLRIPGRPREYFGDPEATARTWVDGWLVTGDLGRVDEDGYLYIVGRSKDVIIRGGNNIHPTDVEHAIESHPAVREVAVVGVAHPVLGEDVVAFVVLRPGAQADRRRPPGPHPGAAGRVQGAPPVVVRGRAASERHRQGASRTSSAPCSPRTAGRDRADAPGAAGDPMPAGAELGPSDPVHRLTLPDVLAEHRRSRPTVPCASSAARSGSPTPSSTTGPTGWPGPWSGPGCGRGDRVVWLGQNCHRLIETWLAVRQDRRRGGAGQLAPERRSRWSPSWPTPRPAVVIWQHEEIGDTVEEARSRWEGTARWLQHDDDRRTGQLRGVPGRRGRRRRGAVARGALPHRSGAPALHRRVRRDPQRCAALPPVDPDPGGDGGHGAADHRRDRVPQLRVPCSTWPP